jgi:hypothetical protein
LVVVQPANIGIVAQIASSLTVHVAGLIRLRLDLRWFHNVCAAGPFRTGSFNPRSYLAFEVAA